MGSGGEASRNLRKLKEISKVLHRKYSKFTIIWLKLIKTSHFSIENFHYELNFIEFSHFSFEKSHFLMKIERNFS